MEKIVGSEEVLRGLLASLSYTEEEQEKLKRITHAVFFQYSFPFPQENLWIYTTEKGIYHQFSKFTNITGYVYSICFVNGSPVTKSWAFILDMLHDPNNYVPSVGRGCPLSAKKD